jgi:predicted branched-subunit amino acid permease
VRSSGCDGNSAKCGTLCWTVIGGKVDGGGVTVRETVGLMPDDPSSSGAPVGSPPGVPASGAGSPLHRTGIAQDVWSAIVRQAGSIGVSLIPFGLAFGVSCTRAGLSWVQALGFSSLVFTGGSQFAAVGVLGDGGGAAAAIGAGLLLSVRSLVYGLVMAPTLTGRLRFRALASQLMIDESVAVGTAHDEHRARRIGYLAGGLAVFLFWNVSTMVGALAFGSSGDLIETWGLDATVPAAFAALVWPRLRVRETRSVALVGALIALVLVPIAPPGIPIVASALGVVAALRRPLSREARP